MSALASWVATSNVPYLTPQDLPEDDDCRPLSIPASSEWLALFGGALTELTKKYNWQDSGGLSIDDTVAKMTEIIDNWYSLPCNACTTPGGYRVIRINSLGKLEQLNPDGDWEPATDEYYIPPPAARTDGSPDDQVCLAAKNAVNVLKQLYEEVSEAFADNLSEAQALTDLIAAAIALVGFEFAPISWAIAAFFLLAFHILYDAIAYIGADLWTEEFDTVLTCILVGCASNTDGVVAFDNDCFNNAMSAQVDSGGLSEVQLRLFTQIGYLLLFIGGIDGLNLAGRTTEITNDECECAWCLTIDLTAHQGDFVPFVSGANTYGTYVGGMGWKSLFFPPPGNSSVQALIVCLDLPSEPFLTYIGWELTGLGGSNETNVLEDACGTSVRQVGSPWEGAENWQTLSFDSQWYPDVGNVSPIYLTRVTIKGTGEIPDLTGWEFCPD